MDWIYLSSTGVWGSFADSRRCGICDVPPGAWHLDWCDRSGKWTGVADDDDDEEDDDDRS